MSYATPPSAAGEAAAAETSLSYATPAATSNSHNGQETNAATSVSYAAPPSAAGEAAAAETAQGQPQPPTHVLAIEQPPLVQAMAQSHGATAATAPRSYDPTNAAWRNFNRSLRRYPRRSVPRANAKAPSDKRHLSGG